MYMVNYSDSLFSHLIQFNYRDIFKIYKKMLILISSKHLVMNYYLIIIAILIYLTYYLFAIMKLLFTELKINYNQNISYRHIFINNYHIFNYYRL